MRSLVAAIGLLLALLPVASPATAAVPPFRQPVEWRTICTAKSSTGTPLVRGTNCRWLRLDGAWRRYLVYVPRNRQFPIGRRWPLVFMFHGTGGTGERFHKSSTWKELAEQEGFVVVFPTSWRYDLLDGGNLTKWNHYELIDIIDPGVRLDGYPATAPQPARDVRFVDRMLVDIGGQLRIDGRRRFLAGFSNGAQFAARVAVERAGVYAAAAWNAGTLQAVHDPARNVPILFGLGTDDELLLEARNAAQDPDITAFPLDWEAFGPSLPNYVPPVLETMGMKPDPDSVVEDAHLTTVDWTSPSEGEDDGQVVRFLLMDGVTHQYPRSNNNPNHFWFAQRSWAFFEDHPLP